MEDDDHKALKADKRDYAIAKYVYHNAQIRIGDLERMPVNCFYAEDAVNCLLDSPWATGKDALFSGRESCVDFCHELLCKELFHRAKLAKRKPKPGKPTDGNDTPTEEGKKKKKPKAVEEDSSREDKGTEDEKKKRVKKLKLVMAADQFFDDGKEVYVWIYEPVSWKNSVIGMLILVGSIAVCCYPLWPPELRTGIYYLSLAGAGFLGVILFLAILRYVVYGIVFALTMGKHHFFLLPNLTEDCGFFESFVPLYEYSQEGEQTTTASDNKKVKGEKEAVKELTSGEGDVAVSDKAAAAGDQKEDDSSDFEVIQKGEMED